MNAGPSSWLLGCVLWHIARWFHLCCADTMEKPSKTTGFQHRGDDKVLRCGESAALARATCSSSVRIARWPKNAPTAPLLMVHIFDAVYRIFGLLAWPG